MLTKTLLFVGATAVGVITVIKILRYQSIARVRKAIASNMAFDHTILPPFYVYTTVIELMDRMQLLILSLDRKWNNRNERHYENLMKAFKEPLTPESVVIGLLGTFAAKKLSKIIEDTPGLRTHPSFIDLKRSLDVFIDFGPVCIALLDFAIDVARDDLYDFTETLYEEEIDEADDEELEEELDEE